MSRGRRSHTEAAARRGWWEMAGKKEEEEDGGESITLTILMLIFASTMTTINFHPALGPDHDYLSLATVVRLLWRIAVKPLQMAQNAAAIWTSISLKGHMWPLLIDLHRLPNGRQNQTLMPLMLPSEWNLLHLLEVSHSVSWSWSPDTGSVHTALACASATMEQAPEVHPSIFKYLLKLENLKHPHVCTSWPDLLH